MAGRRRAYTSETVVIEFAYAGQWRVDVDTTVLRVNTVTTPGRRT